MEKPDRWVIVEVVTEEARYFKVLATWYGGYVYGDSWKLSSNIQSQVFEDDYWNFYTASGNHYKCHKDSYGMGNYTHQVFTSWKNTAPETLQLSIVDEASLV